MHDRIFANQQQLEVPTLKQHAVALTLDATKFNACLDSGKFAEIIKEDMEYGTKLGVGSTPTIFINGRPLLGAQPFEVFQSVIDEELARVK
jgi:protein-disulfide isomerase